MAEALYSIKVEIDEKTLKQTTAKTQQYIEKRLGNNKVKLNLGTSDIGQALGALKEMAGDNKEMAASLEKTFLTQQGKMVNADLRSYKRINANFNKNRKYDTVLNNYYKKFERLNTKYGESDSLKDQLRLINGVKGLFTDITTAKKLNLTSYDGHDVPDKIDSDNLYRDLTRKILSELRSNMSTMMNPDIQNAISDLEKWVESTGKRNTYNLYNEGDIGSVIKSLTDSKANIDKWKQQAVNAVKQSTEEINNVAKVANNAQKSIAKSSGNKGKKKLSLEALQNQYDEIVGKDLDDTEITEEEKEQLINVLNEIKTKNSEIYKTLIEDLSEYIGNTFVENNEHIFKDVLNNIENSDIKSSTKVFDDSLSKIINNIKSDHDRKKDNKYIEDMLIDRLDYILGDENRSYKGKKALTNEEINEIVEILKYSAIADKMSYNGKTRPGLYNNVKSHYEDLLFYASDAEGYNAKSFKDLGTAIKSVNAFVDNLSSGDINNLDLVTKEKSNKFIQNISRIQKQISSFNDYLEVIGRLTDLNGYSDFGEMGFNGTKISHNEGGSVRVGGKTRMIDYHSHPWQGYKNLMPSASDLRSYLYALNDNKDKNGNPYLKEAYISQGDRLLKIDFSNIDWGKTSPEELRKELFSTIMQAVKDAGGEIKNSKSFKDKEWYTSSDPRLSGQIEEAVNSAMLSVLSKYGGNVGMAHKNASGQYVDMQTGEIWAGNKEVNEKYFDKDIFNGADEIGKAASEIRIAAETIERAAEILTGNDNDIHAASDEIEQISEGAVFSLLDSITKEIQRTNTKLSGKNGIGGTAQVGVLETLRENLREFLLTDRTGVEVFGGIKHEFNQVRTENDIILANKKLYTSLVAITKELSVLKSKGLGRTKEYRDKLAERKRITANLDSANEEQGYLMDLATAEANALVAKQLREQLDKDQKQAKAAVDTKINAGYVIDSAFQKAYEGFDASALKKMADLMEVMNGNKAGINVDTLFKSVQGIITGLEDARRNLGANVSRAPKQTTPVSDKDISAFVNRINREIQKTGINAVTGGSGQVSELAKLRDAVQNINPNDRDAWDDYNKQFEILTGQNNIIEGNEKLYRQLVEITQDLINLKLQGKDTSRGYQNKSNQREAILNKIGVAGTNRDALDKEASKDAYSAIASKLIDSVTKIGNDTALDFQAKFNKGFDFEDEFYKPYVQLSKDAKAIIERLMLVMEGTATDAQKDIEEAGNIIKQLTDVKSNINSKAIKQVAPVEGSKISSRIDQFSAFINKKGVSVDENLNNSLLQYIEKLKNFENDDTRNPRIYEMLEQEGDQLKEQINALDQIIKRYEETYQLRVKIAELEISGENPEALADYNEELKKEKDIISSIAQSFGVDDSITAKIFGDPSEYEGKRKEYVAKLQNTIRGIETAKLNEEKRGYGYTEDYENRFKVAKDYTDYLVKRLQDTKLSTDEIKEALKEAYRFVDDINEADGLQQLKRDTHSSESVIVKRNQAANLFSSASTLLTKTSGFGVSKEDRIEIYKIYAELKNISDAADKAGGEMSDLNRIRYDELTARIKDLTAKYKELGVYGNNLFSRIGRTIKAQTISALSRYFSLYDIIRYVRSGINTIKELDTAMVELRKVTDGTAQEYEDFRKEINATASEIASTNKDLISSAADWARLGYSIKEATELARDAQIFVNVGDGVDIKGATDMMITAMKAFNIEADEALSIVDKYNEIGNNFALSATDIGDAMQRSASVLAASNTSFDESIALITAGNEIIQDPEKMGTALRTVALRIRGAKAELEEMGEETDYVVNSTSKLRELIKGYTSIGGKYEGFDIMEDEDTFKSLADIIKGIGEVYDEMSDIDRTAMLDKLAGKNRSNALAAMLQNYKQIDNVLMSIEESEGSAIRENEHIVDSIQGRITKLQTAAENFWQAFLDTDLIKDAVSALTELLNKLTEFIDKHGSGELLAGIASIATLRFTGVGNGFINSIKTIIQSKVAISATQNALSQLTQGTEEYIQAEKELADLNTLCQGSFNSLKISVNKVIGALKKIGPVGWGVIAAITAIGVVITELTKKEIKQIQKVKELADEYSSSTKELSKYKEKIGQLQSILRDESSTTDELIGAKEGLNEINEQLMSSYESLKGRIDLANMSLEDTVDLINKLDQKKLNDIITAATGRESDFAYALSDGFDFTDLGKVFNGSRSELDRAINFYLNGLDARNNTTLQAGLSHLDTTKTAREQYAELLKLIDEQTAIILDENSSAFTKWEAERLNSILLATKDAFDETFEQLGNIEAAYGSTLLSKYEDAYSKYQNAELNYILDKSEETKNALSQALRDLWKTASEEDKVAIEEYMKIKYGESFGTPDDWNFDDYQNNRVFIRHATGRYIGDDSKNGDITNLLSFNNLDEALEYIIEKTGKELKSQEFIDWASVSDSELVSLRGHGADNEIDSGLILFRELVKTSGQDLDYFIDRLEELGYSISPKEDYFRQYLEKSRNESIAKFGSGFADQFDKLNLSTGTQIDIWNSIRDQATNAAEAVEMYRLKMSGLEASTSANDVLKDMEEQYKPTFDAMAEAYKAIWDDKNVFQGMDKITSEQINSVRSQLESVNSSLKENGLDMIDSSEIDDFILTLSDADATADEVQAAFDNIATVLVDSLNPALGQASGETAELMQKTLTELGVTNAEAVVFSRLGYTAETYAKAKEAADAADIDLDAELSSLSDEELQIVANNEALMAYYNGKLLVGGAEITTPEEAQLLIDYCNQMGIAQLGTLNLASAERELRAAIDQTNEGIRIGNMELQARGEVGIANIIKQLNSEKAKVKFGAKTIFNGNENKSSSGSTKSSDSKQKFDWIERAIKKIQRAVTNLGKIADATYKSWGERLDAIMGKTQEFHDEIGRFGQGNIDLYNRPQYINEDGSISTVRSMSFGDEFGNEILVPTIAFDNNGNPYSMSDDEAIARYYETGEYLGLFKSVEEAEEYAEKLHEQQDALYVSGGNSFYAGKYQKLKEEIALQEQAAQAYMQEANAIGLAAEYRNKVMNGMMDIETISDETLKEQISDFQEYYDKATDAADAVEDLRGELAQLAQVKFDMITKQFEEMALAIDHAATRIGHIQSKMDSEGYFESSTLIEQLLFGDKEKLSQLEDEARQLAASIDEAVANGDIEYGSEQWWGMYDSLQNVNDQIVEMKSNMADLNDQLRQMDWDRFDYVQDSIERLRTENDFLIDTLETENQLFEKVQLMNTDIMVSNGNWTETATAIQGLRVNNLEIFKQQNEEVAEEIKKINADLANDPNNKKLLERRNTLIDQQQDIIKGITQEKQSIKSLIQEGYETFLNYLQKSIDKRKEALRAEKNLYDYQRTVSDQTKTITDYRKQLAALSGGTDSEENRARLQQLKDDLTKAEKDLQDTEYERWLTDQEEMMDSMYESFENLINEKLDDLEGLIESAIQQTKDNSDSIAKTIGEQADEFIYDLDNTSFGVNFDARISDAVTAVNSVENAINNMINAANINAQNELAQLQALAQTIVTQAQVQAQQIAQANANINNNGGGNGDGNGSNVDKTKGSDVTNTGNDVKTESKTSANQGNTKLTSEERSRRIRELNEERAYYSNKAREEERYAATPGLLSSERQQHLTNMSYYDTKANQIGQEINRLSKFAKGGTVGSAIRGTGEDGIILARTGEEVLSLERIKQMQGIFKMMQPLAALGTNKTISNIGGTTTVNGMNVSFELPNVTSYEDFVRQAKSDPTFEKLVQNITIGTALGKSKLSKYSL
jgi:TP901 family phage tail tape measure protein